MAEIDTDAECRTERVVDLDGADMLAFILDHGVRVEIGKIGLPLEPEPMPADTKGNWGAQVRDLSSAAWARNLWLQATTWFA